MSLPVFVSVVCVVRNAADHLAASLGAIGDVLAECVAETEIVVVDNSSSDGSVRELRRLTGVDGLPNLQVYALARPVQRDVANWMGMEHALGDYILVVDPLRDDPAELPEMIERAIGGADVVFATGTRFDPSPWHYRIARRVFENALRRATGVRLSQDAPPCRLMNRAVVNFVLQHPQPAISFRMLPATGGFVREYVTHTAATPFTATPFTATPFTATTNDPANPTTGNSTGNSTGSAAGLAAPHPARGRASLRDGAERGWQMLLSSSRAPLRLVNALSILTATASLLYAVYVLGVNLFSSDVERGWTSLSLQVAGSFFLLSLVLLVLGEYVLQTADLTRAAPAYHVAQEFTSASISARQRLNVVVLGDAEKADDLAGLRRLEPHDTGR